MFVLMSIQPQSPGDIQPLTPPNEVTKKCLAGSVCPMEAWQDDQPIFYTYDDGKPIVYGAFPSGFDFFASR
jgi:hypothetical protein